MPERMLRDWTDSEPVNSLDWAAECLFTRLIMKADDFGRFHGNPRLLKSLLFPLKDGLRDADISRWIAACETAGLIRVYTDKVSGKPFIEIRNYGQRLRSKQAKFPDENGNFAVEREKPPQSAASCGGLPQSAAKCRKVPPEVEVEVEEEGRENTAPPRTHTKKPSGYPDSVEAVMALASDPRCAMPITRQQAEAYFLTRDTVDWVDAQRRKITPGKVYGDLKRWLLRDRQTAGAAPDSDAEWEAMKAACDAAGKGLQA